MFNPFKKAGDSPPDVGQEEAYDAKKKGEKSPDYMGEGEKGLENFSTKLNFKQNIPFNEKNAPKNLGQSVQAELTKLEFEKIHAKIEAVNEWLKQFQERFLSFSERLGELRNNGMENEKKIIESTKEATRVIELFNEIKPEELGSSYRKLEMKIATLSEKIDSNKQFVDNVLDEFKELRSRADIFVGTEGLLKLNEDIKKDLIEVQKLSTTVRLHADKSEQFFMELKKTLSENRRLGEMMSQFNAIFPELKKEIEKVKIDINSLVSLKEDIKLLENSFETSLSISKTNQEDIANLAVSIGDNSIKRIGDYEDKMASILQIIDTLAGQISQIRKRVGMDSKANKINVPPSKTNILSGEEIKMNYMKLHPQIANDLIQKSFPINPITHPPLHSSNLIPIKPLVPTIDFTKKFSIENNPQNKEEVQKEEPNQKFKNNESPIAGMRETIQTRETKPVSVQFGNNPLKTSVIPTSIKRLNSLSPAVPIKKQDSFKKDEELVAEIKKLIGDANLALDNQNTQLAREIYKKTWQKYNSLEYENQGLYQALLDLYNELEGHH